MDYVAGSGMFEIPRAYGKLADVVPLRERRGEGRSGVAEAPSPQTPKSGTRSLFYFEL
jgi:hypothetical protein